MASSGHGAQQLAATQQHADPAEFADRPGLDRARAYLRVAPEPAAPPGSDTEQRMQALEDQALELASAVAATREIMTLVERRLEELGHVQARVVSMRAELDASARPARRRSRAKHPCPLSSRELEILLALSDGMVYKQIALELSLSVSTVRTHLHHVYAKLGVADRAQAVLLATKQGWI